ncbi:MAG: transcription-repair coupling factor [Ignavibacterium sp.]
MNSVISSLHLFNFDNIFLIEEELKKKKSIRITSLFGASKAFLILKLIETEKQILILLPTVQQCNELNVELNLLEAKGKIILIDDFAPELIQEKLTLISQCEISNEKFIIISTYDLFNLKIPSKNEISQKTILISSEDGMEYNELLEQLNLLNYNKDKFVEAPGNYSQRGSIIDFWSYSESSPVRIEFDGNFIESIRYFDPESQRSIKQIDKATLAKELISLNPFDKNENSVLHYSNIFDYLNEPIVLVSSYHFNSLVNDNKIDFNKNKSAIAPIEKIITDFSDTTKDYNLNLDYYDSFPEENLTDFAQQNYVEENDSDILGNDLIPKSNKINLINFINNTNSYWIIEEEINNTSSSDNSNKIDLQLSEAPTINSNYKILSETLINFAKNNYKIFIATENDIQLNRLKNLLNDLSEQTSQLIDNGIIKVIILPIKEGFINKKEKILLLTDYQIFNKPYRTKLPSITKRKKSKTSDFSTIKRDDFVVHEEYGIGKYQGLEKIKIGDVEQESMKLLYNQGAIVYVNLNYLHLVKKYSSKEGFIPTLSTLGTSEWSSKKKKTKKRIKEAARDLILLYAKRKSTQGYAFSEDTVWQKELEASFIYEDTPDQEKVTDEVKQDLQNINPMDRLICGDVGFGKTEIAVRSAFKVVQEGMQVAILVPTTILAEQHYNTFKDRLSQFPIKVEVLSRFQSRAKQKEILQDLSEGKVDIVIGTHRLLSDDVKFKELGLLIIDEEHRFGVNAKEKLRKLKVNVDTLALTATPIPRTLNLSLLGARDLSIIATPPPNRQPIYTSVNVFDINKIKNWIYNEINRNGQVYFIHDRIASIEKLAAYLRRNIPQVRFAVAHGQMKPAQLENIIYDFLNKKFDVLISTKIIESGIDIPNVNTIIINRADRFGLAELHQLRGRVGRSERQAYAYLLVPSLDAINKKALRRLQTIEEFTDLGEGFNISMRDLEIRGAGNLLGTEQSGLIDDIGFDLYIKLINEAVEELKNEEFKELFKQLPKPEERTEPTIDTYFEIAIPQNYMPEQSDRLRFYTSLYSIKNIDELKDLEDELIDRFGEPTILVKRLLSASELKYYASLALFEKIIIQRKNIFIHLPKGTNEDYYKNKFNKLMEFIWERYPDAIKFNQQKDTLKLIIENRFNSPDDVLNFLIEFLININEKIKQ